MNVVFRSAPFDKLSLDSFKNETKADSGVRHLVIALYAFGLWVGRIVERFSNIVLDAPTVSQFADSCRKSPESLQGQKKKISQTSPQIEYQTLYLIRGS